MFNRLKQTQLPIVQHLSQISQLLNENSNLVLKAEPGAGKTSLVPLSVLERIPASKKILVLEPRRLAARNAAVRMAELLGETVGKTVGFRIRNEVKISSETRIEVITEGILTRMLQSDPELQDIGLIIFDEFHERSLDADIGLAFALEVQQTLRADLKLLVMSATLDTAVIANLLNGAAQISSEGRSFPVDIEYQISKQSSQWLTSLTGIIKANLLTDTVALTGGDILVFLPGIAEIKKAAQLLQPLAQCKTVEIVSLYGDLPFHEQRRALVPIAGKQKIILSTNIAETSVTIEGVNCVVDSGLMRLSEFDPNVGFDRLHTRKISIASATQRAGRAGRLAKGKCIRLWSESEILRAETPAEILRADLSQFVLELAQWGIRDPAELKLLEQPNAGMLLQARSLLQSLDALDNELRITQHGKQLLNLGVHPRLGHMLLTAVSLGVAEFACLLVALLEEKDPLSGDDRLDVDFMTRVNLLTSQSNTFALKQIRKQASRLSGRLKKHSDFSVREQRAIEESLSFTARLLALAFPDRIAQRRGEGYRLANGSGAMLIENSTLFADFLVVVRLGGQSTTAKIFQAITIDKNEIEDCFKEKIRQEEIVYWDDKSQSVKGASNRKLGEIVLSTESLVNIDERQYLAGMIAGIKKNGVEFLPWTKQLRQWQARLLMLTRLPEFENQFPVLSDRYLAENLSGWLAPFLRGIKKLNQVNADLLSQALKSQLSWEQQKSLDYLMPCEIKVASGSKISVDYCHGEKPVLAVKLQEMFGEKETPRVAEGRIPVVLHLLSPARRPLQITEDLTGFWVNSYQQVKKEMKGRYPKHPWPDDPLNALATRFTKKRQAMDNR